MKKWTKEETDYLRENYPYGSKETIINYLARDWSLIRNKAFKLKIKRFVFNPIKSNCNNLINETNEAYYWLGFIIADGHFNKNNQLQINIGEKDIKHLQLLNIFLGYENELLKPKLCINYKSIKLWLETKLKITSNKTYNPCDLFSLSGDKLFSFIIGFIDGDGSIDMKGYLHIKCHSSWLNNLNFMVSFLTNNEYNRGIINSEGLASIHLTKINTMNSIKSKIILLNLPFLKRKWDRVKKSREEKYNEIKEECFKLFELGVLPKEIVKEKNLGRDFTYRMYNKFKKIKND
jgi:hypothetical protein